MPSEGGWLNSCRRQPTGSERDGARATDKDGANANDVAASLLVEKQHQMHYYRKSQGFEVVPIMQPLQTVNLSRNDLIKASKSIQKFIKHNHKLTVHPKDELVLHTHNPSRDVGVQAVWMQMQPRSLLERKRNLTHLSRTYHLSPDMYTAIAKISTLAFGTFGISHPEAIQTKIQ